MKINFFLLFVFSWITGLTQPVQQSTTLTTTKPNSFKDLTVLSSNYSKWRNDLLQTQNLVSVLNHDTCLNKKFSIVFYIIDDSAKFFSNPPSYPTNLNNFIANSLVPTINTLNNMFKRICVSFQNCSTVVIPNYPYNAWSQQIIEPVVTSNWYTTQTINFYLPSGVQGQNGVNNAVGYTYMPGSPVVKKDLIVMSRAQLTNTVVLFHLMGHYFGLPNTHDEIGPPVFPAPIPPALSNEYVNRTNCYTNGDGFCDTEADSYPAGFNFTNPPVPVCHYDYGPTDGFGKYYTPPIDNFMSEYGTLCRCKYTQEQWNFMAYVMITSKFYLH